MASFDASMQASATLKERFVWLVYLGAVFFLLYGAANEFASLTAPHFSFVFDWEKDIDFIAPFIVPYMSSDVVFVIAFLLAQTRFELRVLALRVLFIVLLSVFVFLVFPLQFSFEKPEINSFGFLFTLLEADKPFNQLPSLHVSFAVVFWFSMKEKMPNIGLKIALASWLILIIMSTVFVFQHHFIDLPTGLVVGLLAVYLLKEGRNETLITKFMTPRHLKMGLYFLLTSIVLMVLSFKVSPLFIYPFLCTFSVSLIYAFGLNNLLVAADGKANFFQWLLFAPYFLGCKISWLCYKRSLPLVAKVTNGVFIGRHPSAKEYTQLSALDVTQVINLASELQLNKTKLIQHRFNFLDQTIQSPESLHQAVQLIESNKSEGIYIHCALGLSRSILVIWAWMLFNGKSNEEIEAHIAKIRPRYVQSKYMQINIALYESFLETHNNQF
jgi:membrane-associated phospholipid phosphatase